MFVMMVVVALLQSAVAAGVLAVSALAPVRGLSGRCPVDFRGQRQDASAQEAMSFTETVQDIVLVAEETEVFGATPTSRLGVPPTGSREVRQPARPYPVPLAERTPRSLPEHRSGDAGRRADRGLPVRRLRPRWRSRRSCSRSWSVPSPTPSSCRRPSPAIDERVPFMHQISGDARPLPDPRRSATGTFPLGRVRCPFAAQTGRRSPTVPVFPVLHDVSLAVRRGEAIGIVGPSGAGES